MRLQLKAKEWTKLPNGGTVYNSGAAQLLVMATDPAFTGTEVEADWDALQFNVGERFHMSSTASYTPTAGGSIVSLDWYVRSHWDGHIDVNTRIHVGAGSQGDHVVASYDGRLSE